MVSCFQDIGFHRFLMRTSYHSHPTQLPMPLMYSTAWLILLNYPIPHHKHFLLPTALSTDLVFIVATPQNNAGVVSKATHNITYLCFNIHQEILSKKQW